MMGIIMRTMCFVKSNIFQTRMTSCSLYMHLRHTVLLGLFPGNTLILQSKRRGEKKGQWCVGFRGKTVSVLIQAHTCKKKKTSAVDYSDYTSLFVGG